MTYRNIHIQGIQVYALNFVVGQQCLLSFNWFVEIFSKKNMALLIQKSQQQKTGERKKKLSKSVSACVKPKKIKHFRGPLGGGWGVRPKWPGH